MSEQPISPERVLSLRLRGTTLDFPDGKPFCLACGAPASGTRRAHFQTAEPGGISRLDGIVSGIKAISEGVSFDAPLCASHRVRAVRDAVLAPLLGLAGVGVLACGAVMEPRAESGGPANLYVWAVMAVSFVFFGPMVWLWKRKDRVGLACEVVRGDGIAVHLIYPAKAPGPPDR